MELAQTPTRLKRLDPEYQERLINCVVRTDGAVTFRSRWVKG